MSKPKTVTSVRVDPELFKKARRKGIDFAGIFEKAMLDALNLAKCPTCGRAMKKAPRAKKR